MSWNPYLNSRRDLITKQLYLAMALKHIGCLQQQNILESFWRSSEGRGNQHWIRFLQAVLCETMSGMNLLLNVPCLDTEESLENLVTERWTNPLCKFCRGLISIPGLTIFYLSEETDLWITQKWSYQPKLFKKNVGKSSKIAFLYSVTKNIYTLAEVLQNCIT